MAKLKSEVQVDGIGADIDLELTAEQAVRLLQSVMTGGTIHINLKTPITTNGKLAHFGSRDIGENPAAYAE